MRTWFLLGLALVVLVVSGDEAVVDLDETNFDEFIESNPMVLVEFYAPWCGHCKALAPEYEKAAQKLKAAESKAVLAKVDATKDKNLATRYGIRGFPTLKFFSGNTDNPVEYGGGRQEEGIVSWIEKRAMPAVTVLESQEDLDAFKTKDKVVLVGFVGEGSAEATALEAVANKYRDNLVSGQVTSADIAGAENTEVPSVLLYRKFDQSPVKYDGALDEASISAFVEAERFPLIDQIGPENYQDYVNRGLPIVWIAIDPSEATNVETTVNTLNPFAAQFKGQLSFTWVDSVQFQQHVDNLGITAGQFLIAADAAKYKYNKGLDNADELKNFFDSYGAGTLEKFLKSQPVPESNDDPVFVLVGKNFDEVVGQDKDVLVEFYAPWCGHCKRLEPEYVKVGEAFSDVDDVVIAKVDATENDTREPVEGFPTLVYYPRGQQAGEKYEGERTSEAIIAYLKEKTSADVSKVEAKTEL